MSGEAITVWGPTKVIEAAGAAIPSNSLGVASGAYAVEADGLSYPDAEFVLTCSFSVAPTDGAVIGLYARPLEIDGAAGAESPETTIPRMCIGLFQVNNVTTPQSMVLMPAGFARDVPRKAEYSLHNNGTGQAIAAGWTLKVTPRSYKAAA